MRRLLIVPVVLGALAIAGSAGAASAFNVSTGTGSVDRADVQAAFGWSHRQTARNAHDVTFSLDTFLSEEFRCQSGWDGYVSKDQSTVVNDGVGQDYTLTGYGVTSSVQWPAVGDPCPSGDGSSVLSTGQFFAYPNNLIAHFGEQNATLATALH